MIRSIVVALAVLLAAPAFAQRAGKSEFYLSPVFSGSHAYTFEGGSSAYLDTGTGFALGYAYNFDAHFSLGGEISWSSIGYRATIQPGIGNISQPVSYSSWIDSRTIRLTGTYNLLPGNLTPFVTAGAGWTYVDTGIPNGLPQQYCWYYPWWGPYCGVYTPTTTTTKFSYNAGLGLRLDFGRSFTVRGMAGQQWVDFGGNYGVSPLMVWRIDFGTRF